MRQEREIKRIELSSSGEFQEKFGAEASTEQLPGSCDLDFVFGKHNTNECDNRAQSKVKYSDLTLEECIFAAQKAGAHTYTDFELGEDWQDSHPKGCFVHPCVKKVNEWCMFHNDIGDTPRGAGEDGKKVIRGVPVCRRERYKEVNAQKEKAATDPAICKDDEYEVVMKESDCLAAAACLGDCVGESIRIGINDPREATLDSFPPGCFLHDTKKTTRSNLTSARHTQGKERRCVFWNNPNWTTPKEYKPKDPKGKSICVVKKPDHVSTLDINEFLK